MTYMTYMYDLYVIGAAYVTGSSKKITLEPHTRMSNIYAHVIWSLYTAMHE